MHHKINVTLNLFQGLFGNVLTVKTNEMLKQVQHAEQIDDMTQYGHSFKYKVNSRCLPLFTQKII